MNPNTCDRYHRTICAADERVYLVEVAVGPCAEAPEGYGCEVELCQQCYLIWTEGLDRNPKQENP
jgi:hypothetical protein